MPWLVVVLLAAGFALLFGVQGVDVSYDRQVRGHKVVLALDAEWRGFPVQGEFGAVFQDDGRVRPSVDFRVDLTPKSPSPFRLETLPQLRFELFSLEGLRVRVGDRVQVGDLVAVRDPKEYERILQALEQATADGDSELMEELQRRREAQEVRSLIEGEVVHIGLFQDGPKLTVVVYLVPIRVPAPTTVSSTPAGAPKSEEGEVKGP